MSKRAYTVLELLVVVGIIVVIASLLMPVFSHSKERAKQTVCVSNLRQHHQALELYRQDHDEYPVNLIKPAFLQYLSGVDLRCPVAVPKPAYSGDYRYRGSPLPPVIETHMPGYNRRFLECREARGSEFPLVWDDNHATKLQGMRSGGRFVLVLRISGAVKRQQYRMFLSGPCQPPVDFLNL